MRIKSIVKNKFISDWLTKINDHSMYPGLRLYKMFKHEFKIEPYLQNIKNVQLRKSFTRFRCSSHFLEIERGRYVGKLENERLCSTCGIIEDEFHFVMICPLYNNLRINLMGKILNLFPFLNDFSSYDQFLFLLGFVDRDVHYLVSRYIHDAMNVRSGVGGPDV